MSSPPPPSLRRFLRGFQRLRCYLCGCVMRFYGTAGVSPYAKNCATTDHVKPRSAGNMLPGNALLACRDCNERKDARQPFACEVFYAEEAYRAFEAAHRAWWLAFTYHGRREARQQAAKRRASG